MDGLHFYTTFPSMDSSYEIHRWSNMVRRLMSFRRGRLWQLATAEPVFLSDDRQDQSKHSGV